MELAAAKALHDRFQFRIDPEPSSGSCVGEFDLISDDGRRVFCEVKSPFHPEESPRTGGYLLANTRAVSRIRRTVRKARVQLPTERPSLLIFCGILQDRPLSPPFLTIDACDALYEEGGVLTDGAKDRVPSGILFIDATRDPTLSMALALNPVADHKLMRDDFSGIAQCSSSLEAKTAVQQMPLEYWPVHHSSKGPS